MATETITYTGELVVETCWCGITHAVPRALVEQMRRQRDDGKTQTGIYCPLGHSWIFTGKSKVSQLQKQLDERDATIVGLRDQLDAAERESRRQAKRASNGVCPCCDRSFVQLARHMRAKHPDYAP